jgi:hypothetical protein
VTTVTNNDNSVICLHDQSPALPRGRLTFAIDATASRAPTWAIACDLQAKMFREAAPIGRLAVQLVYYRASECQASKWVSSGEQLAQLMNRIEFQSGNTQIGRVLGRVLRETNKAPVQAVIIIGDACEESLDELAGMARKLGTLRTPLFLFHEGGDPDVRKAFQLLALKSGGRYFKFNANKSGAIQQLSEQLNAVARLAVGDIRALQRIGATAVLTDQRG